MSNEPVIPAAFDLGWTAALVLVAALVIIAIVSVARSQSVTPAQRVLWLLGVLLLPGVGAVAWLATAAIERTRKPASHPVE